MQLYEGTKRLRAQPMTRLEYNAYRGWTMPENEDATEAGYLVEYQDGGKANDSRHAGYISWSPADVFDRTYKPVPEERTDLAPHQLRVIVEERELAPKLTALENFFTTPAYETVPGSERVRLKEQQHAMSLYLQILRERIDAF